MVGNAFCSNTAYIGNYDCNSTATVNRWYCTGAVGPKRERQKKNPLLLNPVNIELRIFFPDTPIPKKDSFKRTSQLTISRIGW